MICVIEFFSPSLLFEKKKERKWVGDSVC